jgi:hypothetical protein
MRVRCLVALCLSILAAVHGACTAQTLSILSVFYHAMDGPNWLTKTNWMKTSVDACGADNSKNIHSYLCLICLVFCEHAY